VIKAIRRWWRYLGTKLGMTLDEVADPRVQLEQAIDEAREQHRLLTEQAANVIASQTQLQARLDRAIEDYGKANASARQAVRLADDAQTAGSGARSQAMTQAAEGFVTRSIALETEIESLKRVLLEATAASERARQAVTTSSDALQKRLAEREALLSKLDQAKVQEQMNAAMAQLGSGVGGDVPSLDEVRTKIEHRLAAAQAMTEVGGAGVDMRMLEVEQAQREAETAARLAALRAELGIRVLPPQQAALPAPRASVVGAATPEATPAAVASDGAGR
jgi:phage shock protein A